MTAANPPVSGASGGSAAVVVAVRGIELVIEILLAALLVFLPAAYGTVDAWSESIAMAFAGAIAVCLAVRIVLDPPAIAWPPVIAVTSFVLIGSLQLVPAPRALLQSVSRSTVQVRSDLLGDLPAAASSPALDRMTISFYPLATRHDLRIALLAVIVLAAVVIVFRKPDRLRRLLATIAVIGLAIAALALAQDVSGTQKIYWLTNTDFAARSGPFINHSHFAQFMNLSIGAALGLLLLRLYEPDAPAWRKLWRLIWHGGTVVIGLLTVFLSLSRGGMAAILIAGSLTLLIMLARRSFRWLAPVLITLAIAVVVGLIYFGFDRVYDRLLDPSGGLGGRWQMVRDTGQIIRRFPLVGTGLGTFEWVYPAYNRTNEANTASHLENEYVQNAAEMGLLGLGALLAFVAIVWVRFGRSLRSVAPQGVAAIGLGYGLAAVMIHSLSDFGQHLPAVAALSAAVCGLLLNLGSPARANPIARPVAIVVCIAILGCATWTIMGAETARRAEAQWSVARRLAREMEIRGGRATPQDYADLIQAADAAVAAEPEDAHRRYWAAVYHWRKLARQRDPQSGHIVRNAQSFAEAELIVGLLNEARLRCPTYAAPYAVLGQIEYNFLGRAIGVTHIHTAARLDPNDPAICFLCGEVDARRGRDEAAVAMLRRAVALDKAEMDDVIDLSIEELKRPELAIRVAEGNWRNMLKVAEATQKRPEFAEQSKIAHRRTIELLEQRVTQSDADSIAVATLASLCRADKRYTDAERYFARALQLDPGSVDYRVDHANVLSEMGRYDEAIREARTALQMAPDLPQAKWAVQRLTGSTTPQLPTTQTKPSTTASPPAQP